MYRTEPKLDPNDMPDYRTFVESETLIPVSYMRDRDMSIRSNVVHRNHALWIGVLEKLGLVAIKKPHHPPASTNPLNYSSIGHPVILNDCHLLAAKQLTNTARNGAPYIEAGYLNKATQLDPKGLGPHFNYDTAEPQILAEEAIIDDIARAVIGGVIAKASVLNEAHIAIANEFFDGNVADVLNPTAAVCWENGTYDLLEERFFVKYPTA